MTPLQLWNIPICLQTLCWLYTLNSWKWFTLFPLPHFIIPCFVSTCLSWSEGKIYLNPPAWLYLIIHRLTLSILIHTDDRIHLHGTFTSIGPNLRLLHAYLVYLQQLASVGVLDFISTGLSHRSLVSSELPLLSCGNNQSVPMPSLMFPSGYVRNLISWRWSSASFIVLAFALG